MSIIGLPGGVAGSAVDKKLDVRFVGSINGRYTLSSRRGEAATGRAVEVFAFRVLSISPANIAVTAPVQGALHERLTAFIEGIGIVGGTIARLIPDGFVFDLEATDDERRTLAARIRWLKRRRARAESDKREHKRFLPHDARTSLILADGRMLKGLLIDISRSGAAVSADIAPSVGDHLMVGRVPAKVVRLLNVGFAVEFDEVQPAADLEQRLGPHTPPDPEA